MATKNGGRATRALPRKSKARYVPLGGKSRRYYDTVSEKSISWYEWSKRTGGEYAGSRRARERGYRNVYQRRKARGHALGAGNVYSFAVPETVEARKSRERALLTRARQRADARQRDLARSYWLQQHGPATPLDMKAALSDHDFQVLAEQLRTFEAEEATHVHMHGTNDPFYSPYGPYAKVLEALGRRPEDYPYEPGDSPTGTVYYMGVAAAA